MSIASSNRAGEAWAGPAGTETTMPKNSTRAAALARRIQAATGVIRYTDALSLFTPDKASLALAAELGAAGLADAAKDLVSITYVCAEARAWFEAYGVIERAFYGTDYSKVRQIGDICSQTGEAVLRRAGFEPMSMDADAEVYHLAFLALSHAGSITSGQRLVRAALQVFDEPLMCSDIVRSQGRDPFSYASAAALSGPDVPAAVAARTAARAMAAAAHVPFRGDEEWHEAAAHMAVTVWHACVAAGLPPLEGFAGFRDFLPDLMDGTDS
ncbi:hypothetical protein [Actinacidiphila glaucinigra]|uniref:hypothetical protein n=1 Tax=Actinacidiphila glaucinigra TaxID=235986 RepID=UPI003D8C5F6B